MVIGTNFFTPTASLGGRLILVPVSGPMVLAVGAPAVSGSFFFTLLLLLFPDPLTSSSSMSGGGGDVSSSRQAASRSAAAIPYLLPDDCRE